MIDDDPVAPSSDDDAPPRAVNAFEAAIAEVAQLTLALTSANGTLAFAEGARMRGELECALSRTQVLPKRIADGSDRAAALRRLGEMQAVATRALMLAPAPSVAATEAAKAGDATAWGLEEQAWTAVRLASGSSPRLPMLRRERHTTRPETPHALRDTPEHAHNSADNAISGPVVATHSSDNARNDRDEQIR